MGETLSTLARTVFFPFSTLSDTNQNKILFGNEPAQLVVRRDNSSNEVDFISLQSLLETRCKSLVKPFKPVWWLSNGHFQTLYSVLGNFSNQDRMCYHRTYLRLEDGGTLGLDFAPSPLEQSALKRNTPIVVVQHGLTGGSYEPYVRAVLSRVCAPVEEGGLGYRAVVINFRGCAGVPLTSPLFYSGGHTNDTRQALRYIAHMYPDVPILGIGFSLGANVLMRYLGEEGESSRLHAACALACPWDLRRNNEGLLSSLAGKYIYSKAMARNLLRLLRLHEHVFLRTPDHNVTKAWEEALKLENPTLDKFDDTFTRIGGGPSPIFPFRNADEYYIWASSHRIVENVTIPFLAINSTDDPIVQHVPIDNKGNGLGVMVLTCGGGHLGWFEAGSDGQLDRWTTQPVLEWIKVMGQEVVHEPQRRGASIYVDGEGFLRETGKEHLGCKQIEGGGLTDGTGGKDGILQGL